MILQQLSESDVQNLVISFSSNGSSVLPVALKNFIK